MDVLITDDSASRQFGVAQDTFELVLTRNPQSVHVSSYTFGGRHVRFRVVGSELADQIVLPFSHLRANGTVSTKPQLTIDLWDENTTTIRRRANSTIGSTGWYAYSETSPEGRFFTQRLPNTFTCLDRKANRIIGSIAWSNQVFNYERAKPLNRPLLEWHNDQNVQVIHGGLVSQNGQGVLFVGKSGSGKSTSALACLCAGFQLLAEDFVGLERQPNGTFWGHSLYNSVFLKKDHLARFPTLQPFTAQSGRLDERKSSVILAKVFPERLGRVAPITVLVVTRVVKLPEARIKPASKAEALLALGPSSLFQIPSRGRMGFTKLAELAETVPSYSLEIGRDLQSIPRRVEELLAEVAAS